MATQFAMLEIMNAALISEGYDEIIVENDGSNEWRLLSRNWPLIVEAELEDGNYYFTREQSFISVAQPGKFAFDWSYAIPQSCLHVRRLWTEGTSGERDFPDWGQDGQRVYVNEAKGVWIETIEAATSDIWTANFSRGVQMRLQAVLLRFKEEPSPAQMMDQQAEVCFQRARTHSSKARSATEPYKTSRFAKARFGRG